MVMWKSENCMLGMRENKSSVWNEIFYLKQRDKLIWKPDQLENSAIPLKLKINRLIDWREL
jgi:hypothetical protein